MTTLAVALNLMIEKAMDADGSRLFQDGEKSILKNAVEAAVLQDIRLQCFLLALTKVEEPKAELKSKS